MLEVKTFPNIILPLITQLLLSVPPDVKKISSGNAPIQFAIVSRAFCNADFAGRLNEYKLDALPYSFVRYGIIASSTSGASLVVAELSAYIYRLFMRIACTPLL